MNKNEVFNALQSGKTLNDLFEFTDGQECLIYKADSFEISDNVIYIPDIFLNEVKIDRILTEDEIRELPLYSGNDFMEECDQKEDAAMLLFSWCSWEHPNIQNIMDELDEDGHVID